MIRSTVLLPLKDKELGTLETYLQSTQITHELKCSFHSLSLVTLSEGLADSKCERAMLK